MSSRIDEIVETLRDLRDGSRHLPDVVTLGDLAVPALERMLRGPTESVPDARCLAADALGVIRSETSVDALVRALDDSTARELDPVLEHAEYVVINRIAENLGTARSTRSVPSLVRALEHRAYPACATALGQLGDACAIPLLVRRLCSDVTREPAQNALRAFARDAVRSELEMLMASGRRDERIDDAWGRSAAVDLLAEMAAEVPLRRALFDPSREVRFAAATALARTASSVRRPEIAVLVDELGARDWRCADEAARALTALGPSATEALTHALDRASGKQVLRIIDVLCVASDGRALTAIGTLASHTDPSVRLYAVETVARSDTAAATRTLACFIHDDEREIRLRAAHALAARGSGALESLLNLRHDNDARVRAVARAALASIGRPAVEAVARHASWHDRILAWRLGRRVRRGS